MMRLYRLLKILLILAGELDRFWPEDSRFNNEKEYLESLVKYLTARL